jgi:hypothetical protein
LLALPDAGHFVGQLVFLVLEGQWQRQQLQPAASITAYKFNSSIARIFVNKPVNHLSTPHDSCTNNRTPRQFSFFPRQIVEISGIWLPSKTLVTAPWTPWAQALQGNGLLQTSAIITLGVYVTKCFLLLFSNSHIYMIK